MRSHDLQQVDRVGTCVCGVCVGEQLPDVAETRGTQQRVGARVRDDVAVAVSGQASLAVEGNATEHQRARRLVGERVDVDAGVVTLTGTVGRRTTAAIAARLATDVPGVVTVVNNIRFDFDDSALARSRVHRTHPFSAEPFYP